MQYYGTRLSENISKREPEGYLLCLNVPVARTGTQEYLPQEIGLSRGMDPIPVYRPEEEVFAPETIASFEGMPVTNDHPPDGVDIDNIRRLQMGHAHNVRRGTGDEADLLLADLIITDPRLIDRILSGKREISCGYTYELAEENGKFIQRKIRGNHIAVVDAGRAGPRVSIKDHKTERRPSNMKKTLTKLLARMAKDGDIDTVAEVIEELIGDPVETPAEAVAEAAAEAVEAVEEAVEAAKEETAEPVIPVVTDEDGLAGVIERLDRLIALLTPAAPETPVGDEDPEEEIGEAVEEVLEAAAAEENDPAPIVTAEEVAEIFQEVLDPDNSITLEEMEDECDDPDCVSVKDAMHNSAKNFRSRLKKMTGAERVKSSARIAARVNDKGKRPGKESAYDHIRKSSQEAAEDARELGKRIMAARNSNYKCPPNK